MQSMPSISAQDPIISRLQSRQCQINQAKKLWKHWF